MRAAFPVWQSGTGEWLNDYDFGSIVAPVPMLGLFWVKQLWGDLASQYLMLSKNMVIGYTKLIR